MEDTEIKYFVEAALLAAGRPLSVQQLQDLFDGRSTPDKSRIRQAIADLEGDYEGRGLTVSEVASGFRLQIKTAMAARLQKLWEERPPRYSRALFETLALIAYRQPITRGEIEEVRGVTVSSNIMRSLMEREWVRVVGHRDVPGRPAMFGTTRQFLDYFGLKKLDDLPPLADLSDWESLRVQLDLPEVDEDVAEDMPASAEIREMPALRPETEDAATDDEPEPDAEALAQAESLADSDFEQIVASEWPDPAGEAAMSDEPDSERSGESGDDAADEEADASVGRA
jgi:segregation and condensation protein B